MSAPECSDDSADENPIPTTDDGIPTVSNGVSLSDTQIQALREAKARRAAIDAAENRPSEIGGAKRDKDPTRFGDWERAGRAVDFS